jgi:hypothetical protein
MKQEEANQAARNGDLIIVATAKVRGKILERAKRLIEGTSYVMLGDFLREINEIKGMLSCLAGRGRRYTVALSADLAQAVMLALLLVPDRQMKVPGGGRSPGNSAEAAEELERAIDEARRVSNVLWGSNASIPTIESWQRELSKTANRQLVEQLMVARRTDDAHAHDGVGRPLAHIPPAPKELRSAGAHAVELQVRNVDEDPSIACVKVMSADNPDAPAMKGMLDRRLRLAFDETRIAGIAKLLALAQVTDVHVQARVRVTRGLGTSNAKRDELELSEVIDEIDTRKKISLRLLEMKAVNRDLFVESESGLEEKEPAS